MKNSILLYLTC